MSETTNLPATNDVAEYELQLKKGLGGGSSKASFNYIKINYDTEADSYGKYVLFNQGDETPTVLGDEFIGTIVGRRNQYLHFSDERTERMKTNEFEDFSDTVKVFVGGALIHEGDGIATYMKENFPERKFNAVLYVAVEGKIYRMKITPGSCSNLFEYESLQPQKVSFQYPTHFSLQKEKKGATPYWAINFKAGVDLEGEDYKEMLKHSFNVHKMLDTSLDDVIKDAEEILGSKKN